MRFHFSRAETVARPRDTAQATEAVEKLASAACMRSGLVLKLSILMPPQLEALEEDLRGSISVLKDRNRIFGTLLSINELLDPLEERENLDIEAKTFGDDSAIIAEVCRREAVRNGDAVEVDSDDINTALLLWSFRITQNPNSPIDDKGFVDGVVAHPKPFDARFTPRIADEAHLREVMAKYAKSL
ncbi:hypothetical protein HD554DRAFT_1037043 [Boletus coccyginus]|nr:hypothetical protein HD554DRAFT_1037043 [Boletus coccyginus]